MRRPSVLPVWRAATREASWQQWVLVAIAVVAALGARHALFPHANGDFFYYMGPWLQTLRAEGFSALGTDFANYNPPFLYVLYLGTFLPVGHDLTVVKLVATGFDLLLAIASGLVVHRLRGSVLLAVGAGVGILFLPEVLLNSAMWGQVDATYTSLLVLSAYFLLGRRDVPAWVLFGLAFAFKLQALFFLPWIAVAFVVQRHRWRAPAFGLLALLLTYVPALLAGRSVSSLAQVYVGQAAEQRELTANAVNLYQWLPAQLYETFGAAGKLYAVGLVALLCTLYLRRGALLAAPETWLLQVAAAVGVLVPFVLPQMHDRYFYAGAVLTALCVVVDRWYLVPALMLQVTALCAYSQFLFNNPLPFPMTLAAVVQLVAVVWVVALSLARVRQAPGALFGLPVTVAGLDDVRRPAREAAEA